MSVANEGLVSDDFGILQGLLQIFAYKVKRDLLFGQREGSTSYVEATKEIHLPDKEECEEKAAVLRSQEVL